MAYNPQNSFRGDIYLKQGMDSVSNTIGQLSDDLKKQKEEIKARERKSKELESKIKVLVGPGNPVDLTSKTLEERQGMFDGLIERESSQIRQAQLKQHEAQLKQYEAATAQIGANQQQDAAFGQMVADLGRMGGGGGGGRQPVRMPEPPPSLRPNDYQSPQRQPEPSAPTLRDLLGEAARRGIHIDANKREQLEAFAQEQQENQIQFQDDPQTGARYAIFGNTVLLVPKEKGGLVKFSVGPKNYAMKGSELFDADTGEVVSKGKGLFEVLAAFLGRDPPEGLKEVIGDSVDQPGAPTEPQINY